jgi:hypothetical protein
MHPQQRPIKRLEDLEKYPASYEKKRQQVLSKVLSQPQHWTPHPMIQIPQAMKYVDIASNKSIQIQTLKAWINTVKLR